MPVSKGMPLTTADCVLTSGYVGGDAEVCVATKVKVHGASSEQVMPTPLPVTSSSLPAVMVVPSDEGSNTYGGSQVAAGAARASHTTRAAAAASTVRRRWRDMREWAVSRSSASSLDHGANDRRLGRPADAWKELPTQKHQLGLYGLKDACVCWSMRACERVCA